MRREGVGELHGQAGHLDGDAERVVEVQRQVRRTGPLGRGLGRDLSVGPHTEKFAPVSGLAGHELAVRSKPLAWGDEAERGPSTSEEIPITSAATTSAMALAANTDFVLPNRSGFIDSSIFSVMGKPTEGLQKRLPAIPRWSHPVVGRATEGSVTRPSDRVELMEEEPKFSLRQNRLLRRWG